MRNIQHWEEYPILRGPGGIKGRESGKSDFQHSAATKRASFREITWYNLNPTAWQQVSGMLGQVYKFNWTFSCEVSDCSFGSIQDLHHTRVSRNSSSEWIYHSILSQGQWVYQSVKAGLKYKMFLVPAMLKGINIQLLASKGTLTVATTTEQDYSVSKIILCFWGGSYWLTEPETNSKESSEIFLNLI